MAAALRQAGFDAVATKEVNRKGASDADQLAYAITEKRAILTHNTRHFVPLARTLFYENKPHYGIIVAPHLEKGELLRRTTALLTSVSAEELINTLRFL